MQDIILSLLKYILSNYPRKDHLSSSRVTKIIYLIDWKSSIETSSQITNIKWYFNHYGPYVDDIIRAAEKDDDIEISIQSTQYGGKKRLLKSKRDGDEGDVFEDGVKDVVDFVISATKDKSYQDFIKLVYSTYPVVASDRYTEIDLENCASKYNELKRSRDL